MILIVGLGNPGEKYEHSRHNVGWMVLSHIIEGSGLPSVVDSSKYSGKISEGVLEGKEVRFLFPSTFMNKSGSAVKKCIEKKEEAKDMIVVYDDVDLPLGEVKISFGKGSGGHNGLQSIIDALGTKDFARIRVGVAKRGIFGDIKRPKGEALSRHVLSDFGLLEERRLKAVLEKGKDAVFSILREGREKAMSHFN